MDAFEEEIYEDIAVAGGKVLLFTIDDVVYGIEIRYVDEIIGIEQITVVPKMPAYIKGVINIRGQVVPIISVRTRFGKEEIPYDERTCIVVLELDDGNRAGIIVDRVREVLTVSAASVTETPDVKSVNADRYIKHIIEDKDGIKLLLDCNRLCTEK